MKSDFLIVHKKILPVYYEKVLEARQMVESGAARDVSAAVRAVGISRSTYYKYKDFIYSPDSGDVGRKAVISMQLSHEIGVLSTALNRLSEMGVNVLTISQSLPIRDAASVGLNDAYLNASGIYYTGADVWRGFYNEYENPDGLPYLTCTLHSAGSWQEEEQTPGDEFNDNFEDSGNHLDDF